MVNEALKDWSLPHTRSLRKETTTMMKTWSFVEFLGPEESKIVKGTRKNMHV